MPSDERSLTQAGLPCDEPVLALLSAPARGAPRPAVMVGDEAEAGCADDDGEVDWERVLDEGDDDEGDADELESANGSVYLSVSAPVCCCEVDDTDSFCLVDEGECEVESPWMVAESTLCDVDGDEPVEGVSRVNGSESPRGACGDAERCDDAAPSWAVTPCAVGPVAVG